MAASRFLPAWRLAAALAASLAVASPGMVLAQMGPGDAYDPGADDNAPIPSTWWDIGPAGVVEAGRQADLRYVEGMRPHHAGALTLARDYLADPEARNPALRWLAQSIIPNQGFEIGLLDEIGRLSAAQPRSLGGWAMRPMATDHAGARQRFLKTPPPGLLSLLEPGAPVTARDVRFAKEMAVHHRAAVRMAQRYNADPASRNNYLKLLNVGIVTDQTQEILVMERAIAAYPGDADAIQVDPATIPGMEHMMSRHGEAPPGQGPS